MGQNSYVRGLITNAVSSDPTVTLPNLDPVITGANGGVRTLFDLGFPWSYPGGSFATAANPLAPLSRPAAAAPANGAPVYDMTRRSNLQARASSGGGSGPTYAGGGFDFNGITYPDAGVRGPSDAWATIKATSNAYFLWVGYFKLPTSGNFNTGTSGFTGMFASSNNASGYAAVPDALTIAQYNSQIQAVRQKAINSADPLAVTPTADHFGKVCQLAYWRTAAGTGFRLVPLIPASGTLVDLTKAVIATGAVGAENTADYSTTTPQWGVPTSFNGSPMNTTQQNAAKTRLYRGWLEDLNTSGRDPLITINSDLQRCLDRYNASAAANGGTSLIFV